MKDQILNKNIYNFFENIKKFFLKMQNDANEKLLKKAFDLFDYEKDETIDPKVLTSSFIEWKYAEKHPYLYQLICNLDQENLIGGITFDQFKDVIIDAFGDRDNKENANKLFTLLDLKRNDKLDKVDLNEIFLAGGLKVSMKEIEEMINVLASDGQKISRNDFLRMQCELYNIKE